MYRIHNLSIVLDSIAFNIDAQALSTKQSSELNIILDSCYSTLHELKAMETDFGVLGTEPLGLRATLRKASKKLAWDSAKVHEIQSRIVLSTMSLQTYSAKLDGCVRTCLYQKPH